MLGEGELTDDSAEENFEIWDVSRTYDIIGLDGLEIKEMIKKIERKMLNYAKEFQFEKAAILRDKIIKLKNELKN